MKYPDKHVEIMNMEHLLPECTLEACNVCQDLEKLEKEVEAVQEILKKLSEKRIVLKHSRNAVHDRLSTKLPVEILSRIFILVDNFPNKHPAKLSESEAYFCAPVILSSVCRRWRQIALSLPKLWTNLHINVREKPNQIAIIEEWLERSGAQPLNLTIYFKEDESQSTIIGHESICKILRPHSARWQYLELQFDVSYFLFNKLQTMPQSDSLELLLGSVSSMKTIFLDSPFQPSRFHSIHTVSLGVVPCEWNNLTHLDLNYYEIDDILGVIRAAPKLKRCVLQNINHRTSKLATHVEHNVLEDLDIAFKDTGGVTKFFQNITLPSLRHLKYDLKPHHRHEHDFDPLKHFFVRSQLSSTSLQTFNLQYYDFSFRPSDLPQLAGVTHLSIDLCHLMFNLNVLKSFLLHMSDPSVFPRLQDLQIKIRECRDLLSKPYPYLYALSDFITKHNLQLEYSKAGLEQEMSGDSIADDNDIPRPQKNAQDLGLTNTRMPPYRPLRLISIEVQEWYKSEVVYIAQRNSESDAALQESWFPDRA